MYDIITFGSATQDNFLRLKKDGYRVLDTNRFLTNQGLCFSLGSKIFIEDLNIFSGGGGTNTAATFARQGFRVAYVGKVGDDKMGESTIEELKGLGVNTSFVKKEPNYRTAYSVILSSPHGERTILIYRGACHFMTKEEVSWGKIKKTKWFYLAPLSEKLAELFGPLVDFAKENNIEVAANPGNTQIKLGEEVLKPILSKINVLFLNEEEASLLTKIPFKQEEEVIKQLSSFCPGIIVITKGKDGSVVFDGKHVFRAGVQDVPVVDKAGAGDAFGSGFLSGLLLKNDIEYAIQLATANAAGCVQETGTKNGLLSEKDLADLPRVLVEKMEL